MRTACLEKLCFPKVTIFFPVFYALDGFLCFFSMTNGNTVNTYWLCLDLDLFLDGERQLNDCKYLGYGKDNGVNYSLLEKPKILLQQNYHF